MVATELSNSQGVHGGLTASRLNGFRSMCSKSPRKSEGMHESTTKRVKGFQAMMPPNSGSKRFIGLHGYMCVCMCMCV